MKNWCPKRVLFQCFFFRVSAAIVEGLGSQSVTLSFVSLHFSKKYVGLFFSVVIMILIVYVGSTAKIYRELLSAVQPHSWLLHVYAWHMYVCNVPETSLCR